MNARFLVKYKPQSLQVLLQNARVCRSAVTVPAAANRPGMWPGGSLIAIVGQSPLLNIVSHEHSQAQREAEGKHVIPITGNLESKPHGMHEQTS